MNAEYIHSRPPNDRDAVVTYSRVPPRRRPERSVARGQADGRTEPMLEATEVRPIETADPAGLDFSPGDDLRAGHSDPIEDEGQRDWLRYGLVGASLAVIAGVGILAASVGVAIMPGQKQDASGAPGPVLESPDRAAETALATDDVREIPMSAGVPEKQAAALTEVEPTPIPRARPDDIAARSEPESPQPASSAGGATPPQGDVQMATPTPPRDSAEPAAPESRGNDNLILSIEETLARIDAGGSDATPAGAPPQATYPPVLPPSAVPPVVMSEPGYPPSADIMPPPYLGSAPTYEVAPPPGTVEDYGDFSVGPVPPEPVPDAFPQAPYLYPQGEVYPQAPGIHPVDPYIYPSDPYAVPSDMIEETETKRPGFLRRTFAKASGVVERVFSKN